MFIFDGMSLVVFVGALLVVYGILEVSDNENFKTQQSKVLTAIIVAILLTLIYSYFISTGTETLLTEPYVSAATSPTSVGALSAL
tara:strand:+ start:232 stop:486 length:255 start_codon:yes stop_codon:yes gene_type:complete